MCCKNTPLGYSILRLIIFEATVLLYINSLSSNFGTINIFPGPAQRRFNTCTLAVVQMNVEVGYT